MKLIDQLNDASKQNLKIALDDGSVVDLSVRFVENQQGWTYCLTYGTFEVNNRNLVNSPNLLRAFRDIIPFGLACIVSDGQEPWFKDDFTTGRVKIYILDSTDVTTVEEDVISA
jgi:hypothetical protein